MKQIMWIFIGAAIMVVAFIALIIKILLIIALIGLFW